MASVAVRTRLQPASSLDRPSRHLEFPMDSRSPDSKPVGAWVLFFVLGLLLVAYGVYLAILPSADPDHWKTYTTDPDVVAYLADDFRASGGLTVAFGVLTALTS